MGNLAEYPGPNPEHRLISLKSIAKRECHIGLKPTVISFELQFRSTILASSFP